MGTINYSFSFTRYHHIWHWHQLQIAEKEPKVRKWLNEQKINMEDYIINRIKNKPEFFYVVDIDKDVVSDKKFDQNNDKKQTLNIKMTIKMDQFAGIQHDYIKDMVLINDEVCFQNVQYKLRNYILRQCSIEMYDDTECHNKSVLLKPKENETIYIPMDICQYEYVNKAINDRKCEEYSCALKRFAA